MNANQQATAIKPHHRHRQMSPLFAEAAASSGSPETESDESATAPAPDDFEHLRVMAREQGDELEAIASRLAGLNFGRLGVVTRELECTRQQVTISRN